MPVLKDIRKTKEIILPNLKAKVVLFNTLLTGETEQVYEMKGSDMAKARKMLSMLIKEWDLTDETGKVLPHNEENLAKIPLTDLNAMIEATDFVEKKN